MRDERMSDKRLIKSIARLRKALEKELSELDVLIDAIRYADRPSGSRKRISSLPCPASERRSPGP